MRGDGAVRRGHTRYFEHHASGFLLSPFNPFDPLFIRISQFVRASPSGSCRTGAKGERCKAVTTLEIRIERIERIKRRIELVRGDGAVRIGERCPLVSFPA